MTTRQTMGTTFAGIFWAAGMTWWHGDFGTGKMVLWVVGGTLFALAWAWCMKRWVRPQAMRRKEAQAHRGVGH
jgi:hypothetical protein